MTPANPGPGGYLVGAGLILCAVALGWSLVRQRRRTRRAAQRPVQPRLAVYSAGRVPVPQTWTPPAPRRPVATTRVMPAIRGDATQLIRRYADATELIPRQR